MTNTLYVMFSIVVGALASTQLAMLGAMGRERGPYEAAWVSILGTIAGLAAVVVYRSVRGDQPDLPAPLHTGWPFVGVLVVCTVLLLVSLRGLELYFVLCGMFATVYLLTVGFAVPHIGAALFLGAATGGTLLGSAVYDHVGAFGAEPQEMTALRVAGIAVIFVGVALVRAAP
jgi:uncharacterized membrane protein YdcZ (DUF606 family)